jgi:hypothetical protein
MPLWGTRNDENYYSTLGRCRFTGHGRWRPAKVPPMRRGGPKAHSEIPALPRCTGHEREADVVQRIGI